MSSLRLFPYPQGSFLVPKVRFLSPGERSGGPGLSPPCFYLSVAPLFSPRGARKPVSPGTENNEVFPYGDKPLGSFARRRNLGENFVVFRPLGSALVCCCRPVRPVWGLLEPRGKTDNHSFAPLWSQVNGCRPLWPLPQVFCPIRGKPMGFPPMEGMAYQGTKAMGPGVPWRSMAFGPWGTYGVQEPRATQGTTFRGNQVTIIIGWGTVVPL